MAAHLAIHLYGFYVFRLDILFTHADTVQSVTYTTDNMCLVDSCHECHDKLGVGQGAGGGGWGMWYLHEGACVH